MFNTATAMEQQNSSAAVFPTAVNFLQPSCSGCYCLLPVQTDQMNTMFNQQPQQQITFIPASQWRFSHFPPTAAQTNDPIPNPANIAAATTTPYPSNQFTGFALGCNEVCHQNPNNLRAMLQSLIHNNRTYAGNGSGNRVSITISTTNMVVAPVDLVMNPYNISANISVPYNAIEEVYIDPYLPELLNIIYKSTSSHDLSSTTAYSSSTDSSTHYRTMLTYMMMSSNEAYRLKSYLSQFIHPSTLPRPAFTQNHFYGFSEYAAAAATPQVLTLKPPIGPYKLENSTLRRNRRSQMRQQSTYHQIPVNANWTTVPVIAQRSYFTSPCRADGQRRKSEYLNVRRRTERRHRSSNHSHHRSTSLAIDLPNPRAKPVDSNLARNRSISVSPRAMIARCMNQNPAPAHMVTLRPPSPKNEPPPPPPPPPMMPPMMGVYNRYVPKPMVSGQTIPGPRPSFANFPLPPPPPPQSRLSPPYYPHGKEGSSRSSDSAFENMPSLTNWDSGQIAKGKGGRKVRRYVQCDPDDGGDNANQLASNEVLQEILDEVKVVKRQIDALKPFKRSDDQSSAGTIKETNTSIGNNLKASRRKSRDRRKRVDC